MQEQKTEYTVDLVFLKDSFKGDSWKCDLPLSSSISRASAPTKNKLIEVLEGLFEIQNLGENLLKLTRRD